MGKRKSCIACKRPLDIKTVWAARPVCYPCYWAAKLYYEHGVRTIHDLIPLQAEMLRIHFSGGGYSYPSDLIEALEKRPFESKNTDLQRWWSPDMAKQHSKDEC